MPDLSPQAKERARRTIEVAVVFGAHADEIAAAVEDVPDGHVLVAVVDADHVFRGTHFVSKDDLVERVPALEGPDGWAMVFSPGADVGHVQRRTSDMADLAQQRVAAIERITSRRQ
jgi:glycine/D-amino acid oxidase-like deaminating enzyme